MVLARLGLAHALGLPALEVPGRGDALVEGEGGRDVCGRAGPGVEQLPARVFDQPEGVSQRPESPVSFHSNSDTTTRSSCFSSSVGSHLCFAPADPKSSRYAEAIESFLESTTLIFTASEDAYRFFVQHPHRHRERARSVQLAFTHFKDHLFLQRIEPRHPRLPDSQLSVPVSWGLWTPLMRAVREGLPELRRLTVHLSAAAAPTAREEVFLDVLREWAAEGYGTVEERAGGLVYTETGRPR